MPASGAQRASPARPPDVPGYTRRPAPGARAERTRCAVPSLLLQDADDEAAGSVDALDPLQLDVRCRRRARDERQRAALEAAEHGERLRHRLDDLTPADDADVQVGDERERA